MLLATPLQADAPTMALSAPPSRRPLLSGSAQGTPSMAGAPDGRTSTSPLPVAPALDYLQARSRYSSNNHETPSCRALDVFDRISQQAVPSPFLQQVDAPSPSLVPMADHLLLPW
uniref:Uncharacterized protein n=1 Tax=Zea mays TaxID=4577 RepID=B6SLC9_MAIZE|nr:hypothetical protein [Zea mays]|eukprot:NP_001142638.1 uncharacterized protein LOC100274915 [Zea mays]